jgi:hypothetical protein
MLANRVIDIEFLHQLIKKYGAEDVEMFKILTSHMVHNVFGGKTRYVPLGYKMIPLNIREVQDPIRLKYKPWREFLISNRCNDLVINQIAPGFPIISDWFYIRNSKKGLFDNKSQYERLKHSELAKDILRTLYEAQRGTYFATSNVTGVNKSSEHIKQWISNKFRRLSEKINDPINYSIEEIIMSDITLSFSSEYVGRTIADTVSLIENSKAYDSIIGKPFSENGYSYLAKYVFEICYNLAALNIKLGVIHGDFHLNNATIGFLYNSDKEEYKVAYQINKDLTFIFPNNGYFSCIIDFSRGMIDPEQYESLSDLSLPPNYKLIKDYDKFTANETNNLLTLYLQLFPNKAKQKEELQVLFKNYYPAVFRLLTCIDLYMFSIRVIRLLKQVEFHVSKKSFDLFDKINKLSENFIATEMNHLLGNPDEKSAMILSDEYPIIQIIKKCFPEFIEGHIFDSIGTITDFYSLENDLKYSLSKYDLFPEALQSTKYYAEKKDGTGMDKDNIIDIPQMSAKRKAFRYEYEKQKKENLEIVKYMSIKYETITE